MDVDAIQLKLATKLRFQIVAFICLGIIYARGAWNVFGVLFLAGEAGPTCDTGREVIRPEENKHVTAHYVNSTWNNTMSTLPWMDGDKKRKGSLVLASDCEVLVASDKGSNVSMPCTYGWVYGSEFESTAVSEWSLVCVRAYLSELSTTMYVVGSMFGALLISPLSDRFGRRFILLLALLAQTAIGISVAWSPNYSVFTALRFCVGFFNMGIALCTYVLMAEMFPTRYRTIPCLSFQFFWAVGVMMTAMFGYCVRSWRDLHLVFSLPNIPCALIVWFLPESLPWLLSQNAIGKAQAVAAKIAWLNSIDLPNNLLVYETVVLQPSETVEEQDVPDSPNSQSILDQPLLSQADHHESSVHLFADSEIPDDTDVEASAVVNTDTEVHNGGSYQSQGVKCVSLQSQSGKRVSMRGDKGDAEEIFEQPETSAFNNCEIQEQGGQLNESENETDRKVASFGTIFLLCRSPRLRLYSIIMFYLFFVNSLSYFGIFLNTPVLHSNQFLNLFFMGAVEIPAYIICVLVCQRLGRKGPLGVFMLTCGIMNIIAMLISEQASMGMSGVRIGFVMLGKFAITGAYSTVYLYAAEIFPTASRNYAMGMSSFFENLGSIAAPFIVYSAKSLPELPMVLFGVVSIIGSLLVFAMPETHRQSLPQTVAEVEARAMRQQRRRM